jgi:Predicted permeases
MFLQIAIAFAAFAVLIFIGYRLSKGGLLRPESADDLSGILVKVLLPFCIISSGNTSAADASREDVAYAFLVIGVFYVVGSFLCYFLFKRVHNDKAMAGTYANMAIYANTGFMGFPMVAAMLGEGAMIYAVIYNLCYNLFIYSLGIRLWGGKMSLRKVLFSPLMLCSYFAVIWFLSPYRFPAQIASLLSKVGDSTVPVSMFLLGTWLVGSNPKEWMLNRKGYLVSALRLIILPLLMLALMKAMAMRETAILAITLISALPIGTMNVILAKQYGQDYRNSNTILMQTMVFSVITIPLVMAVASFVV